MSTSQIAEIEVESKNNNDKHNIVITGFGIFSAHQVNPSWEAIKDGKFKINQPNLNIITRQIDVSYEEVDRVVSALWREHNPILMVHVGLAAHESAIRIEKIARHGPYIHDDVLKYAPHKNLRQYKIDGEESLEENTSRRGYSCMPCSFNSSHTCINVDRICDKLNQAYKEGKVALPSKISHDAGLYVCEYIYQKSLRICDRSIFIHVPNTDKFRLEDIKATLQYAIDALVEEVLTGSYIFYIDQVHPSRYPN